MERLLVRERPMMRLRVDMVDRGSASVVPATATVEWAGRVGHASSYALLTGTRATQPAVALLTTEGRFRHALVGRLDKVHWGLEPEYETAVEAVLLAEPQPVLVTHAAHALVGSSQVAFTGVALLLCRVLADGLPDDEDEVWSLRDRCWEQARRRFE